MTSKLGGNRIRVAEFVHQPMSKNKPPQPQQPMATHVPQAIQPVDPRIQARADLDARRAAERQLRKGLLEQLEQARGSKVIAYVTSSRQDLGAQVGTDAIRQFREQLGSMGHVDHLDLLLITRGGNILVPLRLMSLLREFSLRIHVLIPYMAHSAGTLVALGADQIVMGAMGELGPVDPSVTNPFNPVLEAADAANGKLPTPRPRIPISVEDVSSYLNLALERAKLTPEGMVSAFEALTSTVQPLALGNILRNHTLIRHLARRLLLMHMDAEKEKVAVESIVETLTEKLYAHDYLITRDEAKSIGLKVEYPDATVEALMWELFKAYEAHVGIGHDPGIPAHLGAANRRYLCLDAAVIETASTGHAFCYKGFAEKKGANEFGFNADTIGWDVFSPPLP